MRIYNGGLMPSVMVSAVENWGIRKGGAHLPLRSNTANALVCHAPTKCPTPNKPIFTSLFEWTLKIILSQPGGTSTAKLLCACTLLNNGGHFSKFNSTLSITNTLQSSFTFAGLLPLLGSMWAFGSLDPSTCWARNRFGSIRPE